MKKIFIAILTFFTMSHIVMAADIVGAGSTFAAPLYAKWGENFKKEANINLNYQAIGSGAGVNQIINKTVDFGATDAPLSAADLDKNKFIQFPTAIGAIVPVINITGVKSGDLVLDGPTLANIYLGTIKKWDDPQIAKLNPNVKLPKADIIVAYRSDSSGTTFNFTNYLSKVSLPWKQQIGEAQSPAWVTGAGAKGNDGVAALVKNTVNSIGYVEYAYAKPNNLTWARMINRSGKVVSPTVDTIKAAAANAPWDKTPGFGVILTDQAGNDSWPITSATFVLVYKVNDSAARLSQTKQVLKFFGWAYDNGSASANILDYVTLPDNIIHLIKAQWSDIK